jgi:hypothetical protein
VIDDSIGGAAFSRFILMVALGARLTSTLQLPDIDQSDWAMLIDRLVDSLRGPPLPPTRPGDHPGSSAAPVAPGI